MRKKIIIKPCPFCGSKAEYSDEMGAIMCEGCGFYFECPTTLEQSLETWNRRDGAIIPPKKVVSVKAWAFMNKNGVECAAGHIPKYYMGVPCKIVMTDANYKRLKGTK